jgi:hypothetical protein
MAVAVERVLQPLAAEARTRQAVGARLAVADLRDTQARAQVLGPVLVDADDLRIALRINPGRLPAPKMPGSGASASLPRSQADVEPSSAYKREAASAADSPGLMQAASLAFDAFGIAPMSP